MRRYKPFPVNVLPQPIRALVQEGAKSINCDPAFVALPALAACAGAIGISRRIMVKPGFTQPAVLWCVTVGASGTAKSPAFHLAIQPVKRHQQRLYKQHQHLLDQYGEEMSRWKNIPQDQRGVEPQKPELEHRLVSDATSEALADRLISSPRGLLCAVDELNGWFGSFNQYKSKGGNDREKYLSMHNADFLKIDRKSGDRRTIWIPHAAVSIAGGIQHDILRQTLRPDTYACGLAARLLAAMPDKRPQLFTRDTVSDSTVAVVERMFDNLFDLSPKETADGLTPIDIPLSTEAVDMWEDFHNAHALQQHRLADDNEAAAWAKLRGYALRLTLVIHLMREAASEPIDPDVIDVTSLEMGLALEAWFREEMARIYDMLATSREQAMIDDLVAFIAGRGGSVTTRDVQRDGPRFCRAPGEPEQWLQDLEDLGLGRWDNPKPGPAGGRPSTVFILSNSGDGDKTPDGDSAGGGFVMSPVTADDASASPEG